MNVYTITLENTATGERSASMITRQLTERAAREYALLAIKDHTDLRVFSVVARKGK